MSGCKRCKACAQLGAARVPNEETLEAVREAREGKNLETYASLEEMKAAFEQDP